jgi:hypothetical protein
VGLLLDVLDLIEDKHDGFFAAELPDDDLQLVRDAHGRPRGARVQERMKPIADPATFP